MSGAGSSVLNVRVQNRRRLERKRPRLPVITTARARHLQAGRLGSRRRLPTLVSLRLRLTGSAGVSPASPGKQSSPAKLITSLEINAGGTPALPVSPKLRKTNTEGIVVLLAGTKGLPSAAVGSISRRRTRTSNCAPTAPRLRTGLFTCWGCAACAILPIHTASAVLYQRVFVLAIK